MSESHSNSKIPSLFPDLEPEPHQLRPLKSRLTAGMNGRGPEGETCGSCAHCVRLKHDSRTYLKCGLMRHHWTNGAGTDIRARWPACEHWEPTTPAIDAGTDINC